MTATLHQTADRYQDMPDGAREGADFAALVTQYQRPIYAFLCRMAGNPDDAADLTQETFLRAYRAIDATDAELHVRAWLYRIATNACRDLLRRRARIAWLPWDPTVHERPAPRREDDPEVALLAGEERRIVRDVLDGLAPRQRQALILRAGQGCSCAEIAAILGVSEGAARGTIFRAREEFRRRYAALDAQSGGVSKGVTPK